MATHKNKTITKQKEHRVELAFVITFHKLHLIVESNERPFSPSITCNGFLVALSRVTHKSHIRIMPITPGTDVQYLKKLKPDSFLEIWLGDFDKNRIWDNKICRQFYDHKLSKKENENLKKCYKNEKIVKNKNLLSKPKNDKFVLKQKKLLEPLKEDDVISEHNIPIDIGNLPDIFHELTIHEYHLIWKNTYESHLHNINNGNKIDITIPRCWSLNDSQVVLTDKYVQHAQRMVNDNYTHDDMPKCGERYANNSIDVLSLRRRNWLTGTIMDTFLDTMDLNTESGTQIFFTNTGFLRFIDYNDTRVYWSLSKVYRPFITNRISENIHNFYTHTGTLVIVYNRF